MVLIRVLAVAVLSLLLVACGSPEPEMTVAEYMEWCSSRGSEFQFDDDPTNGEAVQLFTKYHAEAASVNPPPVLEEYHQVHLDSFTFLTSGLVQEPQDERLNDNVILASVLVLSREIKEAENSLPSDIKAGLVSSGCIADD